jgi:hypothetical protein
MHLFTEAFELLNGLFRLPPQHQSQFFPFSGQFLDVLLQPAETDLLSFGRVMREILLNVENLRVKFQFHVNFLGLKVLYLSFLVICRLLKLSYSVLKCYPHLILYTYI